jgi:hypothetical protein
MDERVMSKIASSFKDRVQQRLRDLDLNVAEAERLCGFKKTHLSDITLGRKLSLKADALSTLAKVLKTTVVWLLHGIGPMSTDPRDLHDSEVAVALGRLASSNATRSIIDGIASVGALEDMMILLTALDLSGGECSFLSGCVQSAVEHGYIIDPALRVAGNEYARGFAERRFISVSAKKLVKNDGEAIYAIVDVKA